MNLLLAFAVVLAMVLFALKGQAMEKTTVINPNRWPGDESDPVWRVCHAIAHAEGFGIAGKAPTLLNNPGDLSPGDEHGQATVGAPEFHGGSSIIHFATANDGWSALYIKINKVKHDASNVYSPDMTWQEFANKYAGNATVWAKNVTAYLGTSPSARVGDTLGV